MDGTLVAILTFCIFCLAGLILSFKLQNVEVKSAYNKTDKLKQEYDKVIPLGVKNEQLNYAGFNNKTRNITFKINNEETKINYGDIVKAELIENGKTTMSVGNIVGGAILAGGTGAIIGAMNKNEKIISRKLIFELNSFENPSCTIDLFNLGKTLEVGIDAVSGANEILATIKFILNNKQTI